MGPSNLVGSPCRVPGGDETTRRSTLVTSRRIGRRRVSLLGFGYLRYEAFLPLKRWTGGPFSVRDATPGQWPNPVKRVLNGTDPRRVCGPRARPHHLPSGAPRDLPGRAKLMGDEAPPPPNRLPSVHRCAAPRLRSGDRRPRRGGVGGVEPPASPAARGGRRLLHRGRGRPLSFRGLALSAGQPAPLASGGRRCAGGGLRAARVRRQRADRPPDRPPAASPPAPPAGDHPGRPQRHRRAPPAPQAAGSTGGR